MTKINLMVHLENPRSSLALKYGWKAETDLNSGFESVIKTLNAKKFK